MSIMAYFSPSSHFYGARVFLPSTAPDKMHKFLCILSAGGGRDLAWGINGQTHFGYEFPPRFSERGIRILMDVAGVSVSAMDTALNINTML